MLENILDWTCASDIKASSRTHVGNWHQLWARIGKDGWYFIKPVNTSLQGWQDLVDACNFSLVILFFSPAPLPLLRHFLFKTGPGTTPFFGTATPGYTMATGAVYSTPARPLPRNTLSRGAFKFKKSPKHCSWRCTALSAVAVAVLLSLLLCYCIGNYGNHGRAGIFHKLVYQP